MRTVSCRCTRCTCERVKCGSRSRSWHDHEIEIEIERRKRAPCNWLCRRAMRARAATRTLFTVLFPHIDIAISISYAQCRVHVRALASCMHACMCELRVVSMQIACATELASHCCHVPMSGVSACPRMCLNNRGLTRCVRACVMELLSRDGMCHGMNVLKHWCVSRCCVCVAVSYPSVMLNNQGVCVTDVFVSCMHVQCCCLQLLMER